MALAVDGIPQRPAGGKFRTSPAARAGPPDGPVGLRVSAMRQGVTVGGGPEQAVVVKVWSDPTPVPSALVPAARKWKRVPHGNPLKAALTATALVPEPSACDPVVVP